jgi:hypothetical protein
VRYNNWKMLFSVQRAHGFDVWQEPYVTMRLPMLFNLRMDPFERAEESADYSRWRADYLWAMLPRAIRRPVPSNLQRLRDAQNPAASA